MKTLSLRLSDDLHQRSQVECERLGVSLNALVAVALDAFLSRNSKINNPQQPQKVEMPIEASKTVSKEFFADEHREVSPRSQKPSEKPKKGISWPPVMRPAKSKPKRR